MIISEYLLNMLQLILSAREKAKLEKSQPFCQRANRRRV